MQKKKYKKILIITIFTILIISFLIYISYKSQSNENLEVIFFNVGQGDSIFINTPNNQQILIDGGPDTSVISKIGEQLDFFDHHIDLVILTQPHADHILGLVEVLKRYEVDYVMFNDLDVEYDYYKEWEDIISEKDIRILNPTDYSNISFGEVNFKVIYPNEIIDKEVDDLNDSSIVLKMEFQNIITLFAGDATVDVEEEIIDKGINLDSDILKVAHHGSKYSTSFEFLEKVSPIYAVIQSEEGNKFKHPHKLTLNKLNGLGIEILRNDELGDINIHINQGNIELK